MNPWNLTPMETRALEALIAAGTHTKAAARLRIVLSSLSRILTRAQEKMEQPSSLLAVLAYDRWQRAKT